MRTEQGALMTIHQTAIVIVVLGLWMFTTDSSGVAEERLSLKGYTPAGAREYLNGVADGFQILTAESIRQGRQPLYCLPGKVVLYGRDLLELASRKLTGPQEDIDVVIAALFGLKEKYPCLDKTQQPLERSSP
ncbi:MAG: hypothetical protein D6704_04985 [Nitrospirae bacterium]|nr:MAG: hypothetical protein D6704_04985 [Nitrospirota bacterium]